MRSRYYLGEVRYQGVWYPGNHDPLVELEVWTKVQETLDAHDCSGEKARKHQHYLKGTIWCGTCGARLCVANNTGKMGVVYPYFICLGRQRNPQACTRRAIPIDKAVEAVEDCYQRMQLSPAERDELRTVMLRLFETQRSAAAEDNIRQERALIRLDDERQKLLQAHYANAVPLDLMRTEMDRIEKERDTAQQRLNTATQEFDDVIAAFEQAVAMASNCEQFYREANPGMRRMMNQAFFEKLFLSFDDGVSEAQASDLFAVIFDPATTKVLNGQKPPAPVSRKCDAPGKQKRRPTLVGAAFDVRSSSSKELLVREGVSGSRR